MQKTSKTHSSTIRRHSNEIHKNYLESNVDLRIIHRGSTNCNRSDHLHPLIRCTKKHLESESSASPPLIHHHHHHHHPNHHHHENSILSDGNKHCRSRRWSKTRHKHRGPPNIEPNDSVAPFLVSNLLDKL